MRHSFVTGWLAAVGLLAGPMFAQHGIRPRSTSEDYPIHQSVRTEHGKALAIGVTLLPEKQVKKVFSPALNKKFIVVEIGVFPPPGASATVAGADFALKIGEEMVHPLSADSAAASLGRARNPDPNWDNHDIHGSAGAGIGYERGTDPVTGRPVRGLSRSAGVGAANDPAAGPYPYPDPPPPQDPRNVQEDVENRGLPEGATADPVAGYLYFPVPSKIRKNGQFLLLYLAGESPVTMPLEN
jgi:hypothetical protein